MGLLMALHTWVTPDRARGPYAVPKTESKPGWLTTCKAKDLYNQHRPHLCISIHTEKST